MLIKNPGNVIEEEEEGEGGRRRRMGRMTMNREGGPHWITRVYGSGKMPPSIHDSIRIIGLVGIGLNK